MLLSSIVPELVTVPFSNDDVYLGLAQMSGLAKATKEGLFLEFETKENLTGSGLIKSPTIKISIPLDGLETVSMKKTLLGAKLTICTRNLDLLKDVPGSHQGQITLGIARKDRSMAERLVSTVNVYQSEHELTKIKTRAASSSDTG
jgi:hypothetical protein